MIFEAQLYSTGISLYRLGVRIAGLWNRKAALINRGHRDIERRIKQSIRQGDRVIWIHAASLGEFEQGRPLIEKIRKELPDRKILLTFYSPSGYEVRKDFGEADCVTYLPFDTPGRVRRFLDLVNPEMAIFVKYEIWRNYLYELDRRGIPTYLISAVFRPDQKFFNPRYGCYADWLRCFTHIFVQDTRSEKLLAGIDIVDVDVCGDTRFDRVTEVKENCRRIPELETFVSADKHKMVILAGSSWPEDEEIYSEWIGRHPEVKLIVAPHEFDEKRIEHLKERFNGGAVLFSEVKSDGIGEEKKPQVLVMDCFGLLSSAYNYCDVAYVGGGFGEGLHNINEAAVYGVPVIYGPNNRKFIEAAEMSECGGGIEVGSKRQFERAARMLLDPIARKQRGIAAQYYINSKLGATEKIFNKIFRKQP